MDKIRFRPIVEELSDLTVITFGSDETKYVQMASSLVKAVNTVVPELKMSTIPGGVRYFNNSGQSDDETLLENFGKHFILFPNHAITLANGFKTAALYIEHRILPESIIFQETHLVYRKSDLQLLAIQKRNILSSRKGHHCELIKQDYENLYVFSELNFWQRMLL